MAGKNLFFLRNKLLKIVYCSQNDYLKDGVEYEDAVPPSILAASRDSPLKKVKAKVSFESSISEKSQASSKSGKTPKERWLWAYSKIVKVGESH